MTDDQRRYIVVETAVGVLISAAVSVLFVFIVFGGQNVVPLAGHVGVAFDSLPQSFMIVLMSILMPTFLTRRRLRFRTYLRMNERKRISLPRNALIRSLALAVPAAIVCWLFHVTILPIVSAPEWNFFSLLFYKAIYGALLSLIFSPVAIYMVDLPWKSGEPFARRQAVASNRTGLL
ncbi:hypothetical protein [Nitrospirillum iridis]|uniref:Uncharacterized protein n=1 Tax=Nitrospirillum iridis TaxID=765888 RepID=A0A7X0EI46_9PROT|nr:hypothetical protein [Nitrospirillum iridis]MBB6255389.1 hypothetical protein [Nitrospirillum iridis]